MLRALVLVGALAVSGCGGGGGGAAGSTPALPSPAVVQPAPNPQASGVSTTPSSVAFTSLGQGPVVVSVSQPGATTFAWSSTTCAQIASVTPASGAGPFSVAPIGLGQCSFTVTGAGSSTATVAVSVTTTSLRVR